MGSFITVFICNLLIPLIMVIGGYCMYRHPPKEINGLIGYRTAMSMKNKETWLFAHDYCGKLWLKTGLPLLAVTVLAQLPFIHANENTFGVIATILIAVQLAAILVTIPIVEKALKRTFDENGIRK